MLFVSSLNTKLSFCCPSLRTVSELDTRYRAYHSRPRKNRRKAGRFLPYQAIYAVYGLAQPPDSRTYSAEVTSSLSNLPHHRRLRPCGRSAIILHPPVCVKWFFKNIWQIFAPSGGFLCSICKGEGISPPPAVRSSPTAESHPPDRGTGCSDTCSPVGQRRYKFPQHPAATRHCPGPSPRRSGSPPPAPQ